jgi:hypothetical protein
LARPRYDPLYEIVDASDYAWRASNWIGERVKRAYEAKAISYDDSEFMLAQETLNDESTDRCNELMVKIELLTRIPRAKNGAAIAVKQYLSARTSEFEFQAVGIFDEDRGEFS